MREIVLSDRVVDVNFMISETEPAPQYSITIFLRVGMRSEYDH